MKENGPVFTSEGIGSLVNKARFGVMQSDQPAVC